MSYFLFDNIFFHEHKNIEMGSESSRIRYLLASWFRIRIHMVIYEIQYYGAADPGTEKIISDTQHCFDLLKFYLFIKKLSKNCPNLKI